MILNKTDKSSGEPLKGVEFELRDSKGKVLETLKTDAAGHAESKLYESALRLCLALSEIANYLRRLCESMVDAIPPEEKGE